MPGETCRKSSCCTKPDCSPWTCPLLPSLPPCTVPALTSLFLPVLLDESQTQRLKVSSHGGPSFFSPFSRQIIITSDSQIPGRTLPHRCLQEFLPRPEQEAPSCSGTPCHSLRAAPTMLAPPPTGRTQAGLGGARTPRQGPGRRPPAPAVPSDWAEQEVRSCLAAPKPSAPRPTSAGPRGQCQARELQDEGQQSGLGPGHACPALLTTGRGSAGAGRGGVWKHQAASHQPLFREGFWCLSPRPMAPAFLMGTSTRPWGPAPS